MRKKVVLSGKKKNQGVLLTEGVIWKQLLRFAWPLLLSNFLQQLYNTVDLIIVGQYAGDAALSAVGATGSLTNLLVGFFLGFSTGASVIVAQHHGSQDYKRLRDAIHSSILISIVGGLILSVLGIIFCRPLLILMTTPPDILDGAVSYMKVNFIGMLSLMLYNMGSGILRSLGDSKRPLYLLIMSSVINILLNLLFVKGFNWGVVGAAWATFIAQNISAIIVLIMLTKLNGGYHLSFKELKFHPSEVKAILQIGLPAGLQSVAINFSNVVIQSKINSFGSAAVGGAAAAGRIDGFCYTFANAFGLSATTFIGQNVGAGKFDRAKRGARITLIMSSIVSVVLGFTFVIFSKNILSIFNDNPEVIEYGQLMIKTLLPVYFVFGITEVLSGVLRGAGMAIPPMLVTLICFTGVRLLWIHIMLPIYNHIWIVFLSWPVSWVVGAIASIVLVVKLDWLSKAKKAYAARQKELEAEASQVDAENLLIKDDSLQVDVAPTDQVEKPAISEKPATSEKQAKVEPSKVVAEKPSEVISSKPSEKSSEKPSEKASVPVADAEESPAVAHLTGQKKEKSYVVHDEEGEPILYAQDAAYLSHDLLQTLKESYEQKRKNLKAAKPLGEDAAVKEAPVGETPNGDIDSAEDSSSSKTIADEES